MDHLSPTIQRRESSSQLVSPVKQHFFLFAFLCHLFPSPLTCLVMTVSRIIEVACFGYIACGLPHGNHAIVPRGLSASNFRKVDLHWQSLGDFAFATTCKVIVCRLPYKLQVSNCCHEHML